MGIALYLIVKDGIGPAPVRRGVLLFSSQLAVNLLWSFVFFRFHAIAGGLVTILVLFVLIVATIRAFIPVSPPAASLLLPYTLWVGFASTLNAALWLLN